MATQPDHIQCAQLASGFSSRTLDCLPSGQLGWLGIILTHCASWCDVCLCILGRSSCVSLDHPGHSVDVSGDRIQRCPERACSYHRWRDCRVSLACVVLRHTEDPDGMMDLPNTAATCGPVRSMPVCSCFHCRTGRFPLAEQFLI